MIDSNELENNSTQSSVLCGKSEKITMDISSQDLTVDFNFAECEKAANEQKSGNVKKEVSDISKYLLETSACPPYIDTKATYFSSGETAFPDRKKRSKKNLQFIK